MTADKLVPANAIVQDFILHVQNAEWEIRTKIIRSPPKNAIRFVRNAE